MGITAGNVVTPYLLGSDQYDIAEYDRTSGSFVQSFDIHPPFQINISQYPSQRFPLANFVQQSNGDILMLTAAPSIIRLTMAGAASEVVSSADMPSNQPCGLFVDSSDNIYLYTVPVFFNDFSDANLREWDKTGGFVSDTTIANIAPSSPYTISQMQTGSFSGALSFDGRYLYVFQLLGVGSFSPPNNTAQRLVKYDLVANTSAVLRSFAFDYSPILGHPGVYYGDGYSYIAGFAISPFTSKLYIGTNIAHIDFSNFANDTNDVFIQELSTTDGSDVARYPMSGVSGWADQTGQVGSGTTDPGSATSLNFDAIGSGHLWAALYNTGRVPGSDNNVQIISVDLGSGSISVLPGYLIPSVTSVVTPPPVLAAIAGGFPGLALYPAAGGDPLWGPAFTL